MEGRYPEAIMLTLATCREPDRIDEWLDWYAHIHTPDVTSAGVFVNMIRFRNADRAHGGREIANFSETHFTDPIAALEELKRRRAPFRGTGRQSPLTRVVDGGGPFVKVGGEFQFVKNAPVRGVLIVSDRPASNADEAEFNRWYNDVRIPALLRPGLFQSAYRYRAVSTEGPERRYLCVYETDRPDVAEAAATNHRLVAETGDGGRSDFNGCEDLWWMAAFRIFPLEGRQ